MTHVLINLSIAMTMTVILYEVFARRSVDIIQICCETAMRIIAVEM